MKRIQIVLILALSFSISALSNFGNDTEKVKESSSSNNYSTISGFVDDETNNERLVCAKIEIVELGKTINTDIQGNFSIEKINPGTYTFKCSYISYEDFEMKKIVISNSCDELKIHMKPL